MPKACEHQHRKRYHPPESGGVCLDIVADSRYRNFGSDSGPHKAVNGQQVYFADFAYINVNLVIIPAFGYLCRRLSELHYAGGNIKGF